MNNLLNKKVLIFDLETNGLPDRKPGFHNGKDGYYDYKMDSKYDNCRIVSMSWCYIEDFSYDKLQKIIDNDQIREFIRKPVDFKKIENGKFHGTHTTNYLRLRHPK